MDFMRGNRLRYVGAIATVALTVTIGFLTPRVLGGTVDAIVDHLNGTDNPLNFFGAMNDYLYARGGREYLLARLWLPALMLVVLNVLNGVFQYLRGRWTAQASESIAKNIRDRLYAHLQVLPYDYHVKAQTGDLIQRCTSDVETIRRFLSGQVVEIFRAVLMIIVALVIMLGIHVQMTLYSMILVPPLFLFAMLFFNWVRKSFTQMDEAEGKMSAVLQENLTGVRVVRAFGRQKFEVDKFNAANDDLLKKHRRLCDLLAVYWSASDALSMTQTGVTLLMGVFIVARGWGELTVGEMTIFVSYISMLLWPIRQLGRILSDMGKSFVSLNRIDEILSQKPETEDENAICPPLNRTIEFDNVQFAYEKSEPRAARRELCGAAGADGGHPGRDGQRQIHADALATAPVRGGRGRDPHRRRGHPQHQKEPFALAHRPDFARAVPLFAHGARQHRHFRAGSGGRGDLQRRAHGGRARIHPGIRKRL